MQDVKIQSLTTYLPTYYLILQFVVMFTCMPLCRVQFTVYWCILKDRCERQTILYNTVVKDKYILVGRPGQWFGFSFNFGIPASIHICVQQRRFLFASVSIIMCCLVSMQEEPRPKSRTHARGVSK